MDTPGIEHESDLPAPQQGGGGGSLVMVVAVLFGLLGAVVLAAGILALGAQAAIAAGAGAAVFPVLPLVWHLLAERKRNRDRAGTLRGRTRYGLRGAAVSAVVIAVSIGNLGPRGVTGNLSKLVGRLTPAPEAPPPTKPQPKRPPLPQVHPLERFVPGDATLIVGMAGSDALMQLLSAHGLDTKDKIVAFGKCHINLGQGHVVIATRGESERMVVVRAPGITDEGNLYCLVGALGGDRIRLQYQGEAVPPRFVIQGLVTDEPLTFERLDDQTVLLVDDTWRGTVTERAKGLGPAMGEGVLEGALGRVQRTASLWAASVTGTEAGSWDLALHAQFADTHFKLVASSLPPSGVENMARAELSVPLAFAAALPQGALASGVLGIVSAVAGTGAQLPLPRGAVPDSVPSPGAASSPAPASSPTPAPQ